MTNIHFCDARKEKVILFQHKNNMKTKFRANVIGKVLSFI